MNHTKLDPSAALAQSFIISAHLIDEELHRYREYLRDVRGLATGTCHDRIRIIRQFLEQNFTGSAAIKITALLPDDARRFLAQQSCSHPSVCSAMRSYFRYRSIFSDRVDRLAAAISSPAHWNLASLPRALKPDEVEHLLNAFTDDLRWPKRGYAIVRCALDMGLRCGEIAHLQISDIDWQNATVTLRGTKSLRQAILPLPTETGEALADYLLHERPATAHTAVFVRQIAGQDRPITSTAIQKVIKRACYRAGIPQYSAHALRHTLACRLVEHGSSLKEVADVLRHRSLSTTLIYAKLDTPKLAAVALPWPGCKS